MSDTIIEVPKMGEVFAAFTTMAAMTILLLRKPELPEEIAVLYALINLQNIYQLIEEAS